MSEIQITGFEVLECLGQGGMASVWKARQLSLDRIVAIKVLFPRMARDVSDIERFLTEAKSAAKLKHPGIIQVYDVNAEDGLYFIVMEYVAGYTVGDWLRRKQVLSEEDALLVVDAVADALDYAWNKEKIIHCDIKPDNIIIDSDGTVKVADLGLARTITAMSARKEDDYVMGTPAYMAPEQARGDGDLDCRADIYSLGAMLYHLVTGKILFEGNTDDVIMEKQTDNSAVEDPLDTNNKLTKPLCWLIEKMLAKDRDGRPADWNAVRNDISRVKRGRMPAGPILPEGISSVARSKRRTVQDHATHTSSSKIRFKTEKNYSPLAVVVLAAVVAMLGIGVMVYLNANKPPVQTPDQRLPGRRVGTVQPTVPQQVQVQGPSAAERAAMEMFDFTKKWVDANSGEYAEAISRFEKVSRETKGTKYSIMADDEIRKINMAKEQEIGSILGKLKLDNARLVQEKEYEKAAQAIEGYNGRLAKETLDGRLQTAKKLRRLQEAEEAAKKNAEIMVEQKMKDLTASVVAKLVASEAISAHSDLIEAGKDPDMAKMSGEISELTRLLESVIGLDNKILDSFSQQEGQDITVNLNSGSVLMKVTSISAGKVIGIEKLAAHGAATRQIEFDITSIAPSEKLKRMGNDTLPEVALAKGVMAYSSKAYSHAKRYFSATSPVLSEKLVAYVEDAEKKLVDEDAERALQSILRSLGYNVGPFEKESWLQIVNEKTVPLQQQKRVSDMVEKFRRDFAGTRFAAEAEPILKIITDSP